MWWSNSCFLILQQGERPGESDKRSFPGSTLLLWKRPGNEVLTALKPGFHQRRKQKRKHMRKHKSACFTVKTSSTHAQAQAQASKFFPFLMLMPASACVTVWFHLTLLSYAWDYAWWTKRWCNSFIDSFSGSSCKLLKISCTISQVDSSFWFFF